jgi:hypothetical protein
VVAADDCGTIRRAHRDGMSIQQIARQFGHSRRIVRHALVHAEPHPEPLTRTRLVTRLGPLHLVIDQILADDETAPTQAPSHRGSELPVAPRRTRLPRRLCTSPALCAQAPPAA